MSDLISRQAAIDAVCMEWCNVKHQNCKHPFDVEKDDYYWCDGCETALRTLPDLPSAQPETAERTAETAQNVLDGDLISRKSAIDELRTCYDTDRKDFTNGDEYINYEQAVCLIERLPSAQPETAKRIVGKSRDGMTLWYQCDMCNEPVDAQDDFCRGCGRRLTDG